MVTEEEVLVARGCGGRDLVESDEYIVNKRSSQQANLDWQLMKLFN